MSETKTDLVVKEPSIGEILMAAVQKDGFDVAKMQQLVDLKLQLDQAEAEKAFNIAFAKVQSKMKLVIATEDNDQTNSKYAKLEAVNTMIMPIATKHGFSISFYQGKSEIENYIRVCGDLAHEAGFTKKYYVDLPLDDVGMQGKTNKTKMHGTASTFSYGQRYLVKLAFNVSVAGEDNDGNGSVKVQMNEDQIKDLLTGIGGHKKLKALILKAYNVSDVKYVPVALYEKCKEQISTWLENLHQNEGK